MADKIPLPDLSIAKDDHEQLLVTLVHADAQGVRNRAIEWKDIELPFDLETCLGLAEKWNRARLIGEITRTHTMVLPEAHVKVIEFRKRYERERRENSFWRKTLKWVKEKVDKAGGAVLIAVLTGIGLTIATVLLNHYWPKIFPNTPTPKIEKSEKDK